MLIPRINLENRELLKDAIPLNTPFVIFIDPSSRCNFSCKFCPNSRMKNKSIMSFELFKHIIDQLTDFPDKLKVLRLYGFGEPLLNPRFFDMVKYAKEKKIADKIDTTTNASLINHVFNTPIIDAGIDRINISINGMNDKQYFDFTFYKIDFNKLVDDLTNLYKNKKQCEIIIKINGDYLSLEDKQRFNDVFGPIADGIYIEHTSRCWPEYDIENVNKNEGLYGQPIGNCKICSYIFYQMTVNSDGKVSLCFVDWDRKLIIGDASTGRLVDIWNSQLLKWFQIQMLKGYKDKIRTCKSCGQLEYGMPVDLTPYAEEILERII